LHKQKITYKENNNSPFWQQPLEGELSRMNINCPQSATDINHSLYNVFVSATALR